MWISTEMGPLVDRGSVDVYGERRGKNRDERHGGVGRRLGRGTSQYQVGPAIGKSCDHIGGVTRRHASVADHSYATALRAQLGFGRPPRHKGRKVTIAGHWRTAGIQVHNECRTRLERTPQRNDKTQHKINWRPHSNNSHGTNLRIIGGEAPTPYRITPGRFKTPDG